MISGCHMDLVRHSMTWSDPVGSSSIEKSVIAVLKESSFPSTEANKLDHRLDHAFASTGCQNLKPVFVFKCQPHVIRFTLPVAAPSPTLWVSTMSAYVQSDSSTVHGHYRMRYSCLPCADEFLPLKLYSMDMSRSRGLLLFGEHVN